MSKQKAPSQAAIPQLNIPSITAGAINANQQNLGAIDFDDPQPALRDLVEGADFVLVLRHGLLRGPS